MTLKGTNQKAVYSGQMSQFLKTVKTIEILLVRQTRLCGKI